MTIGADITDISWNLFSGDYPLLSSFSVEKGNDQLYSVEGVLFDRNGSRPTLLRYPPAKEGTSYTVPSNIRQITSAAFNGCALTDLSLPAACGVGADDFTSCESLQRFTVYGDAPKEGYYLFAEDGILYQRSDDWVELVCCPRNRFAVPTAFTVPDNVTDIAYSAFSYCANLTEVTIPESVSYINGETFYRCTDLETVNLPAGITQIYYDAFYMGKQSSLTDVYYAGSKTMWNNIQIDYGNEALTSATIHYGDVTVYSGTMDGGAVCWTLDPATGVLTVSGSGKMTSNSSLWSGMTCIKQVVVEEGITEIELHLLYGSSVEELRLPASAKSIYGTDSDLPNLKTVTVAAGNRNYCTVDNVLFNKDKTFLYRFPSVSDRTAYAIPDTVTEIGSYAFYRCATLTEITIPNSVTYIGYGAFRYCEGLTSITLPPSVTKLGNSELFAYCTALETVTIEGLIPSIPDYTFYGCTALKHISLPGSVSNIYYGAFYDCTALETVTFGGEEWMWEAVSVESDNGPLLAATVTCTGLGTVSGTCGDNLTWTLVGATGELTISGTGRMYNYDSSDIASPTDLTIYGSDLAWHRFAKAVRAVKVNEGVTSIGSCAFYDCTALTEISLPNGITEIGRSSFYNCTELTEISLPDSLTDISDYAFQNCSSLTAVSLPAALNYIDSESFTGCTALTQIMVDEANENYCDVDGVLMNKEQTRLYCYPAGREDAAYAIPEGITTVNYYAFLQAAKLERISLPLSLTQIRHNAFSDCTGLTEVTYPGTELLWDLVSVDDNNEPLLDAHFTFGDISTASGSCGNGTFWTFDAVTGGLTLSGSGEVYDSLWWAFNESITSVTFGPGITDIDWYLFNGDYPLLQAFIAEGSNRNFYTQDGVLFAKSGGRTALLRYPPAKTDTAYTVPEDVTEVYRYAFRNCSALTEVTVPASVTSIDNYAFSNSYSLAAIRVAEDNPVFSSDNGALLKGDALLYYPGGKSDTSYAIPAGTTRLDSEQFGECTALTELHIPFSVGYLYPHLFRNLPNLERIVYEGSTASWDALLDGWASIESYTDAEVVCTNTAVLSGTCGSNLTWTLDSATGTLTVSGEGGLYGYDQWNTPWNDYRSLIFRIVVEEGVNSIGQFAFARCQNATEVRIPASVTFIGPSAFYDCDSLTGFTVAEGSADYTVQNGVLFSADGKTLVAFPGGYGSDQYTVPESVTQVAPYAFRNCDIEEVLIPDTVTSIGEGAFYYCRYLTDLQLPASVTAISYAAFARCESLTQVDIPETVTAIDTMAFQGCGSLSAVEIPSGVTAIGDSAFYDCEELTDITLPEALVSIGEDAFSYSGLRAVDIPDGVTEIGSRVFAYSDVRTAKLPAGIETIPNQAFYRCSALTSVTIPLSVKDINSYAFDECSALSSVIYAGDTTDWMDIYISYGNEPLKRAYLASNSLSGSCGDGVTWSLSDSGVLTISGTGAMDDYLMYADTIPWGDFRELVTSIVVEEGVTAIGQLAFYECYNNTAVSLPASLTSIGLRAFNFCAVPGGFTLAVGNTAYQVRDGVLLTADGKTLVAYPLGGTADAYTVPATVTTISPYAFADCDNLQEIRLPDGLTNIGESAFWDCGGLTSMAIPAGVTAINDETFYSCSSLHTVILPEQVKSIGNQAFSFTGLRSVNIPDTVTSIGYYAFAYTDLQQVEIPAATATIGNRAFYGCYDLTGIYVAESNPNYYDDEGVLIRRGTAAASTVQAVKVISSWNDLKLYVPEEPADVSTDVLLVYPSARTAREYTVPDSVGIIDSGAFLNCPALEKLTLGANITESYTMFNNCDGLTAIKVDEDNPVFYSIDGVLYRRLNATQSKLLCYPRAKAGTSFTIPDDVAYAYFNSPVYLAELTVPLSVQRIDAELNSNATIRYEGSETLWNSIDWCGVDDVICSGSETALSGTVGDSIRWTFDAESDTLILSGSGDTGDFQPYYTGPEAPGNYPPWYHLNYRYVTVEEGITRLGDFALDHDSWINSISLPASLTAMGEYVASLYWPEYEETEIPAGVTDLCGNTFGSSRNITLSPDNTAFVLEDGVLFTADRKTLVAYYRTGNGTYTVPEGVETIGAYAFYKSKLEGIFLPDSVTTVEEYAFYGCNRLNTLTLPGKVETVGIGALLKSGLTELTVENPFMRPDPYWFVTAVDQTDLQTVTFGGTEAQWPAASASFSEYYPNVDVICTGTDGLQIDFDADGNTLYLSGIDPDASGLMVAFYDGSGRMVLAKTYSAAQVSAGVTVTHDRLDFSKHTVKVFLLNGSYAPVDDPIPVHTPAEN